MLKVPSLLAGYRFEGNANDFSGNGHNGTVYGASLTTGKFGRGFQFDGADDYISVPDNDAWYFGTADFTIHLSVNFNVRPEDGAGAVFINQRTNSSIWYLIVRPTTGYLDFGGDLVGGGTGYPWLFRVQGLTWQIGVWYTLCLTRKNNLFSWYRNNILVGTWESSFSVPNVENPLIMGIYGDLVTYPLNGKMDNVLIFNKCLSVSDLKRLNMGLHPLGA